MRFDGSPALNALQEQFVTEARELIRQATDDLIVLERHGRSPERIDRVFRAFHTLKGSAGVVELPAMSIALHAAEDLLAAVRQGTLEANAIIIDQALACLDQVSLWVDDFQNGGLLPAQAGDDGRALAERLRSFLPGAQSQKTMTLANSVPSQREATLPIWVSRLMAAEGDALASRVQRRPAVVCAIAYEPSVGCFFNGDDPLQLMGRVPEVLAFYVEPREAFPPLSDLDPYACNLRLLAISAVAMTMSRGFFGWCQIRCASQSFRSMRFPSISLTSKSTMTHSFARLSKRKLNYWALHIELTILPVASVLRCGRQPTRCVMATIFRRQMP